MTEPTPTPSPNSQPAPDSGANISPPERTGFFGRVRRELKPEPIHPSEAEEIVVMEEGDGN